MCVLDVVGAAAVVEGVIIAVVGAVMVVVGTIVVGVREEVMVS